MGCSVWKGFLLLQIHHNYLISVKSVSAGRNDYIITESKVYSQRLKNNCES